MAGCSIQHAGYLMNIKKYMAIYSLDDMSIYRFFGGDARKLIATCKNKIRLTNARKAWIELYEVQGTMAEQLSKQVLNVTRMRFESV